MTKKLAPSKRRLLLSIANRVRSQMGRKPVTRLMRGVPGEPNHCVLANTIGGGVGVDYSPSTGKIKFAFDGEVRTLDEDNDVVVKSKRAVAILEAFDDSEIPELIR